MLYEVNKEQLDEITKAMELIPERAEQAVNHVLQAKGGKEIMQSILHFMPESKLNKKHAKQSEPLKMVFPNLAVKIFEKPKFGYLVFPNLGIGKRNKTPQRFMEEGLKAKSQTVHELVLNALLEAAKF